MRYARGIGLAGLVAVMAVAGWWWLQPPAFQLSTTADRNVLLITIDTLRADALGAYGGRASTPALDALAGQGARFSFAHAHAVVTLPSHTSLMTGTYPYQHGVRDNTGYRVPSGTATLATRLKAMGFATGAFVGAFPLDQRFGLNQGFDTYDDRLPEAGPTIEFALPERPADQVVSAATTWLDAQSGRWFGWVHVFDPHAPYRAPEPFLSQYADNAYAGEVAWVDSALAPLLQRLQSQPRPTLVIVTADHGESLGEHGELTHGIFAYDATLRVPLLIADVQPGTSQTPRGRVVDSPALHIDIVPTVLDAVGAQVDPALPGTSLRQAINGRADEPRPSYFESMTTHLARGWAPLRGVLVDRAKYIDLPIPERYDLAGDPAELRNFAASGDRETEVLLNTLRTFDMAPPGQPGEESGAVLERLRALGYIGGSPAPPRERYTDADDPKRLIDLDRMLHDAGEAYSRGRAQEAIDGFRAVIARRPDTADAYRYLAFVLWQTGRPADAITTLEQALARGLTQRDIQLKLGLYLSESGRPDQAIAILEGFANDDAEVLNALGIAYGTAGRTDAAMRTFARALELDPTNALAHQNMATLHLRAGRLEAAERALRLSLDADPTLAGAWTGLGVVLAQRGQTAEALAAWQRAVSLDPRDLNALFNLTTELHAAGRSAEARQFGDRFLAAAPPALFAADIARVRALLQR